MRLDETRARLLVEEACAFDDSLFVFLRCLLTRV